VAIVTTLQDVRARLELGNPNFCGAVAPRSQAQDALCCALPPQLVDHRVEERSKAVEAAGGRGMCLAIPGQVVGVVDEDRGLAKVDVAGVQRTVNVGLLGDGPDSVLPGDWVLIHVGFALSKVDEAEALATLKLLEDMGAEYESELEELKASAIE
jgi:hydrogenase expression/formation protein HypC